MSEQEQNRRIAEVLCETLQWNGRDVHLGEHVALLDGEIVAVTQAPERAIAELRRLAPDPKAEWLSR